MRARGLTGAVRANVYLPLIAVLFGGFNELQKCSGRSVLLRVMVDLPGPCSVFRLVFEQFCSYRNQAPENSYTDGKVGAPNQTCARLPNRLGDLLQVLQPSRRTGDSVSPRLGEPLQITHRDLGMRKLDSNVDVSKILGSDPCPFGVVVFVEPKDDLKALPGSEPFDHPAHFSVTDKR